MIEHEKNRIAVLIDAENISYNMMDNLFNKVSALNGQIVYKKAFGNWTKEGLKEVEWQDDKVRIPKSVQKDARKLLRISPQQPL